MKKILLSLTLALLAVSMNAETLYDFSKKIGVLTLYGSTTEDYVKIHTNTDSKPGIKLANSYASNNVLGVNYASVTCDGGFKAGDVVTVAGAFNNSDESKLAAVDFFAKTQDSYKVLFATQQFINGRTSADDPVEETFTLEEDMDTLYFGRNGNTGTIITTLKVVRGEETSDNPDDDTQKSDALVDYQGKVLAGTFIAGGSCSMDESVKIHADADPVLGIKFANSYKKDNALTENVVTVTCDGGFQQGDTVKIAGVYNNADEKETRIHVFTVDEEGNITVLYETNLMINGKNVADDPELETFILDGSYEKIYLGRSGATGTFVTTFIITRAEGETPSTDALADYLGGVNAGTFTAGGTCSMDESVKIHGDTDAVLSIKFSNSYKSNNALTENIVSVTCDGGFLQGDIVKIAGVYSNKDEKETRIVVFALDDEKNIMVLHETEPMINGRFITDDPVVEQFELDGDYETIYLGRQGGTATYVTLFNVTRPGEEDETKPGDVNEDTKVDISDIVAIINHIAGTATYNNADVNKDQKVDISDIVAVINIIAAGE